VHGVDTCHNVGYLGLEAKVNECQRFGVAGCGAALLSSKDIDALCNTSPNEPVPLEHPPGKALEAVRASLHITSAVLGAQVRFYHVPKIARRAVEAITKGETMPLADVLEHEPEVLQAVYKAAALYNDQQNEAAVWQMVQDLAQLRHEAKVLEGVIQAASLDTSFSSASISNSVSNFWECIAQMLECGHRNAHVVYVLAKQFRPYDASVQAARSCLRVFPVQSSSKQSGLHICLTVCACVHLQSKSLIACVSGQSSGTNASLRKTVMHFWKAKKAIAVCIPSFCT